MPDYIPRTDDGLISFATPLSEKLTATPVPYGVSAANATQLASLLSTFTASVAVAQNPITKGPQANLVRDQDRAALVTYIRQLVRQIQGTMTVTDVQRGELGIPIHDTEPSPIGVPAMSPGIIIENVSGFGVDVRFQDPTNPSKRGRPAGVQGLSIFSFVGPEIPSNISDWKFESNTTRMTARIVFPESTPTGAQAWLTAFFYNPRGQSGQACNPVSVIVEGGGLSQAA